MSPNYSLLYPGTEMEYQGIFQWHTLDYFETVITKSPQIPCSICRTTKQNSSFLFL